MKNIILILCLFSNDFANFKLVSLSSKNINVLYPIFDKFDIIVDFFSAIDPVNFNFGSDIAKIRLRFISIFFPFANPFFEKVTEVTLS